MWIIRKIFIYTQFIVFIKSEIPLEQEAPSELKIYSLADNSVRTVLLEINDIRTTKITLKYGLTKAFK